MKASEEPPLPSDPVIEYYKKDVDRTLLRENLRLTPEERLRRLQSVVRGLHDLRQARSRTEATKAGA